MKHSEILKAAKKYLWKGTSDYDCDDAYQHICPAVHEVSWRCDEYEKGGQIAKLIKNRMLGAYTIEDWLFERGYAPYIDMFDDHPARLQRKIQKYRLAWMDQLIKEYEDQGK